MSDEHSTAPLRSVVEVSQGSQPRFGSVRVGVLIAGVRDGVPTARLLLRPQTGPSLQVDALVGESIDLFGGGTLTVRSVAAAGDAGRRRDCVSLEYEPTP